jgi:uncharacterized protein YndB with AHSA1/START domain
VSLQGASAGSGDLVLVISRVLDAPRSLVFQAWTEREHLMRWAAPEGFIVTYWEGDLRPGGRWRACMRSPDGRDYWHGGVYREIVAPERLVYSFAWDRDADQPPHEMLITLTLAESDGKTLMTFRQERLETQSSLDSHEEGWTEAFVRLAGYLRTVPS